jgi:5-formyltetrahydrofolate cyclo-ligase
MMFAGIAVAGMLMIESITRARRMRPTHQEQVRRKDKDRRIALPIHPVHARTAMSIQAKETLSLLRYSALKLLLLFHFLGREWKFQHIIRVVFSDISQ